MKYPSRVISTYTASPPNTAVFAPIRDPSMPNTKAHGMPMNCVSRSAVIIALSGRPICVP